MRPGWIKRDARLERPDAGLMRCTVGLKRDAGLKRCTVGLKS